MRFSRIKADMSNTVKPLPLCCASALPLQTRILQRTGSCTVTTVTVEAAVIVTSRTPPDFIQEQLLVTSSFQTACLVRCCAVIMMMETDSNFGIFEGQKASATLHCKAERRAENCC